MKEEEEGCDGLQYGVENLTYAEVNFEREEPDKEDRLECCVSTTEGEKEETYDHLHSDSNISPVKPSGVVKVNNCSIATDSVSDKQIYRTRPIDFDLESKPESELQQSDGSPASSPCNGTQPEDGASDKWCVAGMLNSTTDSCHFLSHTSSLEVGQPLLPEEVEVSFEECDSQLGETGDLVQEERGSGEGGGGGGEERGGREDGGSILETEGGREVFCGEDGGDILLVNLKENANSQRTAVQESKETGADSSGA